MKKVKYHELTLRQNFSWNIAGNIVYAASQWGIIVVLAKLTTPEGLGYFALALAITAPVIMLTQLNLRSVQATDATGEYSFGHYVGLRLITTAVAFIIISIIAWIGDYSQKVTLVVLAIGLAKAFESISDVCYGLMQCYERMDRIAKSLMLKGPISLAALGLMVFLTGDVFWGAAALAVTWLLLLLFYDLRNAFLTLCENHSAGGKNPADPTMSPEFNRKVLMKLVRLAIPLGIVAGLISLQTNIPRYFIEKQLGMAELGIFAALAYFVKASTIIVSAMGGAVVPRLAKYYAATHIDKYKNLLWRMACIGLFVGLGGVLLVLIAGRPILTILYQPEFADRVSVLLWLMIAGCFSYIASSLGYGMTAARYFDAQLPLFVIVTAATYAASLCLIPGLELHGAACALMIGALVQIVGSGLVVAHALKKKMRERPLNVS